MIRSFSAGKLVAGFLAGVTGEYATPEGYFAAEQDPEGFAAYEATFPYRERLRLPGQLFGENWIYRECGDLVEVCYL